MSQWMRFTFGTLIAVFILSAPLVYAWERKRHVRNLHVVREGVLYRSGQLSQGGLQRIVREYRIKTVVTLRDAKAPGEVPPDHAEEEFCRKEEIRFVRIPQKAWDAENGAVPNEAKVVEFLEIMKNPANHPVLVHCLAGKHRTGAMCAIFRIECDYWTCKDAVEEMRLHGYDELDEHLDLLGFLFRYKPTWLGK